MLTRGLLCVACWVNLSRAGLTWLTVILLYLIFCIAMLPSANVCPCTVQLTDEERDGQAFVRLYIRHVWLRTWRTMLRYNLLACGRETFEGIRIPRPTGGVACRRNPGCCLSVAKNNNGHVEIEHAPRRHTSSNNVVGIHGDPLNVGSSAHDVGGVRRAPSPIIIFGE